MFDYTILNQCHYRLEILGRYPTGTEAEEYDLQENAPIWLPMKQGLAVFTPNICQGMRYLRIVHHM